MFTFYWIFGSDRIYIGVNLDYYPDYDEKYNEEQYEDNWTF